MPTNDDILSPESDTAAGHSRGPFGTERQDVRGSYQIDLLQRIEDDKSRREFRNDVRRVLSPPSHRPSVDRMHATEISGRNPQILFRMGDRALSRDGRRSGGARLVRVVVVFVFKTERAIRDRLSKRTPYLR